MFLTVSTRAPRKFVSLHYALKSLSLRRGRDRNSIAWRKYSCIDCFPEGGQFHFSFWSKFTADAKKPSVFEVSLLGFSQFSFCDGFIAHLYGLIAVFFFCLYLRYDDRARLQNRSRCKRAVFRKILRHVFFCR